MAFDQVRYRCGAAAIWLLICLAMLSTQTAARGQGVDVTARPIKDVRVEGVKQIDAQFVLNQVRAKPGDPYDPQVVAQDIQNITRLGRFGAVRAQVEPNDDGSITLVYVVDEQPLLSDVQVVGNKNFDDDELMDAVMMRAGDPRDPYLIERARDVIRKKYQDAGYFLADVTVDQETLDDNGILILRVREGPRVKVRQIQFQGNTVFTAKELQSKIKTNSYMFIFRKGILSREQIDADVARIRDFYAQRGYLDVRVGRRIELADDQKTAGVSFIIDEGRRYTVDSIELDGNSIYSNEQIYQAMALKIGDVYSIDHLRDTNESLNDLYGKLGYIDTRVDIQRIFDPVEPTVDLKVRIRESRRATVGNVIIRGNALTQDKVIRRQIRGLNPGRPFDSTGIETTKRRIRSTGIISEAEITVLGEPEDEVRDVLVEVKEANTGSISFGAAVSSDSGVFGAIDLTQRNFDIADVPESWGEFFRGRAFRGAGQYFQIALQPGNEFQRYQVSFREPYVFDSDYFLDTNLFFYTRRRENWDEERLGGTLGVGKRFGDVWSASIRGRVEQVDVQDLDSDAVIDAFDVAGASLVDSIGFSITRSTVQIDDSLLPYKGTRFTAGLENYGLAGDYDFVRLTTGWTGYLMLDEDFFGRKTTLKLDLNIGYIVDAGEKIVFDSRGTPHRISDTPLFERFYAGGHRTFRGFRYRGAGPRGIAANTGTRGDDPIGGDWSFLAGIEYNYPIYEDVLRGVFFVDSGTVQEDIGLDEYRVSVGAGIRLKLPFLGQAPFAFDLAYPVVKQDGDEVRYFSFDLALPF
ncbi:outer membrane protein assembly factor BamA [Planctomycetales bacterium ZRK34]|nr:outer membrane protein assembly factor BamA [Planctomycetales bacterium ZRK34]